MEKRHYTFPKKERLKSKKLIQKLFARGKTHASFPLRLIYLDCDLPEDVVAQAGFSVPKRNFKKAVHRNRIKRLMRESYRLQKHLIFNNPATSRALMFLYLDKEKPDFKTVYKAMGTLLEKLES